MTEPVRPSGSRTSRSHRAVRRAQPHAPPDGYGQGLDRLIHLRHRPSARHGPTEVELRSLTGRPLRAFTYYDPSLTREGRDDSAATVGDALVASDGSAASALVADPGFTATSNGYLGSSDGWTDLAADGTRLALSPSRAR